MISTMSKNHDRGTPAMFETTIAGSLPKPGWLAETNKLWPAWRAAGAELEQAKRDATLLWLKEQEAAGIDIVTDGEHKVKMGIRNNRYDAMVPLVVAPLRLKGRVHQKDAVLLRANTKSKVKI